MGIFWWCRNIFDGSSPNIPPSHVAWIWLEYILMHLDHQQNQFLGYIHLVIASGTCGRLLHGNMIYIVAGDLYGS